MNQFDLLSFIDSALPYHQEKWDKAEENERYRRAEHFSGDQKDSIESQGRQAYSIGMISAKGSQVVAEQRRNRTEFKIEAKIDKDDEIKAEIATIQYKDLENRCDFVNVESEQFDSGTLVHSGVWEVYLETDSNLNLVPQVRGVDYKNFMWDSNSVDYNLKDALWVCKKKNVYRHQLEKEYGKKVRRITEGDDEYWGRKKDTFYHVENGKDSDFDILTVFDMYLKDYRDIHYVVFNDYLGQGVLVEGFESIKEARGRKRELELKYLTQALPLGESRIQKKSEQRIDKYVFTIDGVLEHEKTDMPDFPFSLYRAYHFKDQFWTLTDVLKSMQQFIDRYIAQIDYSFGKDIKNAYEVVVNQLADGLTFEDALRHMEESGMVPVKGLGTVNPIKSQGVNPQWIQMVGVMQSYLEDLSGGRSFQGLSESARESGIAIERKQQQGQMLAMLFLDNLSRAKKDLGEKLLWFFKTYDTAPRIIKVGGGTLSPQMLQTLEQSGIYSPSQETEGIGYVSVNTNQLTFLQDAELELKITETGLSETQREKELAQLLMIAQVNPMVAQLPGWNEAVFEKANLPFELKQKFMQEYRQMLQMQSQAAQEEKQMEMANEEADREVDREKNQIDFFKILADSQLKAKQIRGGNEKSK